MIRELCLTPDRFCPTFIGLKFVNLIGVGLPVPPFPSPTSQMLTETPPEVFPRSPPIPSTARTKVNSESTSAAGLAVLPIYSDEIKNSAEVEPAPALKPLVSSIAAMAEAATTAALSPVTQRLAYPPSNTSLPSSPCAGSKPAR